MPIDTMTSILDVSIIEFGVYPNPSAGIFNISLDNNEVIQQINIVNGLGQTMQVFTQETQSNLRTLDLSDLPNGIYALELLTNEGKGVKMITLSGQ